MLLIANELDNLLDVDWLRMGVEMSLALQSCVVHEVVGISHHTRDSAQDMLIDLVQFARFSCWHKKFGSLLLLGSEYHTCIKIWLRVLIMKFDLPSFARTPITDPSWLICSMAYSTWRSLPFGSKVVVRLSYFPDCINEFRIWLRDGIKRYLPLLL